jgi:glutathione-regulated potassium-efflux system ancillary protein KefC
MIPVLITVAFLAGMIVRRIGLPPMVGFLLAGFALNSAGVVAPPDLEGIADFGVTLLLFTIGLKLKVKTLASPEVWAGTTIHMLGTTATIATSVLAFGWLGIPLFNELTIQSALVLGFALSFSSTVFAAKSFEQRAELATRHATAAIGILIMQDVIAVVFLTVSSGKTPSVWAFALLALPLLRPLMKSLMIRVGHGELLLLFGFVMTFAGYGLFDSLGLKGDLGAIAFGMLMAGSPKADEISKVLFGFKDLFLVAFFLSIGLSENISLGAIGAALLLLPFVVLKAAGYFGILCGFRLRARPAFLAGLGLANFSEFGLIVGSVAVSSGWLAGEWLVAIAVLVALSFVAAAPLNAFPYVLFDKISGRLKRMERRSLLPEDAPISCGTPDAVVFGMGRVGSGVYDWLTREKGLEVIGVDSCPEAVDAHCKTGRQVVLGDGTDQGFWERVGLEARPRMVFIATQDFRATHRIADRLLSFNSKATVTALVHHSDQAEKLREMGIRPVYDLYQEAGTAFAEEGWETLSSAPPVPGPA